MNNENKLKEIMAEAFQIPIASIHDDSSMETIDKWDSLGFLALISSIESGFDIKFEATELLDITSYAEIKSILGDKGIDL